MDSPAQNLSKLPEHKRVMFVLPTGKYDSPVACETITTVDGSLSGSEARSFYEELLKEEPSTSVDVKPIKKEAKSKLKPWKFQPCTEVFTDRDRNKFLLECTSGKLKIVIEWFERGMLLDTCDDYGWTALHCAAAAGQTDIALFLIENGANWSLLEKTGKSFADVANKSTLKAVMEWFERQDQDDDDDDSIEIRGHCDQCGRSFTGPLTDHLTNLSHIVRMNKKNPTYPGFAIPEWNPGYRLLRRAGWSDDKGLGKNAQGKKYPVRTILKRDRAGFGSRSYEARVTHFGPRNEQAVRSERVHTIGETKEERQKRIDKERRIEREIRWAFQDPR